ncbi:hypothetical protein ACVIRO_007630 [Rhizobium ruizarguesonis]
MIRRFSRFAVICAAMFLFCAHHLLAGGIHIDSNSVVINGDQGDSVLPGSEVEISFTAHSYEYGSEEFAYVYFYLLDNKYKDMRLTPKNLRNSKVYYLHWRDSQRIQSDDETKTRFRIRFTAPGTPGRYTIRYMHQMTFRHDELPDEPIDSRKGYFGEGVGLSREIIIQELYQNGAWHDIFANITVTSSQPTPNALELYARLDDKNPTLVNVKGGFVKRPLKVSWYVTSPAGLDVNDVKFRYKIWPENDDFGAWVEDKEISLPFLQKGSHRILIQARYERIKQLVITREARIDFDLDQPMILEPVYKTAKQVSVDKKVVRPRVAFSDLYKNSRAILFGISDFDDASYFGQLPSKSINKDIETIQSALVNNGFSDIRVFSKERLTREEIVDALQDFVSSSLPDDRLFIYFSTHGFADPTREDRGYLATSDCEYRSPRTNCLPLEDIKEQANDAIQIRKVRQVLVAVDSCFAGLGVITKAPAATADLTQLGAIPGAFMLTAGLADQKAEIDPQLGMSTFTYFLAEGLNGGAPTLDPNGLMTLSELLVYVRYHVAQTSVSRQIPTMGLFLGGGEMLFKPQVPTQKH